MICSNCAAFRTSMCHCGLWRVSCMICRSVQERTSSVMVWPARSSGAGRWEALSRRTADCRRTARHWETQLEWGLWGMRALHGNQSCPGESRHAALVERGGFRQYESESELSGRQSGPECVLWDWRVDGECFTVTEYQDPGEPQTEHASRGFQRPQ